ncbi:hypothetical protein DEGR_38760 (plasmid) [Deinococcus grandis]|nr:hypothetical protein DEGR_38760 [Deinococcus grandis]
MGKGGVGGDQGFELTAPTAGSFLKRLLIQCLDQRPDQCIRFRHAEQHPITKGRQNPAFHDLHMH